MLSQDDSEHRCDKCNEIYTDVPNKWCKPCNINFFKNNFTNWTSGNDTIDDFIQEKQLGIDKYDDRILEWIPYSQFVDVKEIGKDSYSNATIYSALWNDGLLRYNSDKKESKGNPNIKVALKCLNGSQNIIYEVLDEAENYYLTYGISQNPDTEDYIVVLENKYCEECCEKYFAKIYNKWCKLCHAKNSFANWTSGNEIIDDFIQKILLNCNRHNDYIVREWIPYSQLIDIKELGNVENNVTTLHSALWNDGLLCYNSDKREWIRDPSRRVTLKYLRDSQNLINELSSEIEDYNMIYGISQNPDTKDYILALQNYCVKCYKKYSDMNYKWCKLCYINNFTYWTSGNKKIDNFIQEMQLTATYSDDIIIEWIPYTQFVSIKEIVKDHDNFNTIYSAIWNNSPYYDNSKRKLIRESQQVTLITLNYLDKSCIIDKLLDEIKVLLMGENHNVYGITQNPGEGYIIVCKDIFCEKCEKVDNNDFTVYLAIWKNGPIEFDYYKKIYQRNNLYTKVALKCLNNSQNKINEFLNEDSTVEWIPFDQFINIKEMNKINKNNATIYAAVWKKGYEKVILKCLNNSNNKINELLNEVENCSIKDDYKFVVFGISQNPDTKDYIIILSDYKRCKTCTSKIYLENKWCKLCQVDFFKNNFKNWTSGNDKIDDFIYEMQLKIDKYDSLIFEWIPFNQFINIKKIGKVDNNTAIIYSAIWKDGPLEYNYNKTYKRNYYYEEVLLKYLNNSQNRINEFLNKAESYSIKDNYMLYGISQNPDTKDYIMVLKDIHCEKCNEEYTDIKYKWCKTCQVNYLISCFTNWTSGSEKINNLIQKMQLKINKCDDVIFEWIPYDEFDNIKEVGKGGFATVYSAIWKNGPITDEFLNEIKAYSIDKHNKIMQIYGISQNLDTKNYIIVLRYAGCGNFNNWMDYYRNFSSTANFFILKDITIGLKEIHQRQLVHRDFHIGNILINSDDILLNIRQNPIPTNTYISDMGLCGEVNNTDKTKIYGVMPYVAPEVLRGKTYTKAADIYSFGMIMYFIITGRQPFENCAHDEILALKICRGIRPEIPEISELKSNWYINLMKKCWDSNPDNRPNIESISTILDDKYSSDKEFKEAEQYLNKGYKENGKLTTHPQAIYISRLLNSYTEGLVIDFTELKNEND
ncbi:kinase-like domain-containing protein [Rhizophagus clarus]|uniref:Kinase-like domain-containing protein n=1 Tax=Rhizophagus clarus TaxID=94130 RepID=A0A8H3QZX0_9GLOM|nr:kinase-like domain-containing protein [Rhizophagus clarus]